MRAQDKKYYPTAEETFGKETETLVMEEDAQPLEVPPALPRERRCNATLQSGAAEWWCDAYLSTSNRRMCGAPRRTPTWVGTACTARPRRDKLPACGHALGRQALCQVLSLRPACAPTKRPPRAQVPIIAQVRTRKLEVLEREPLATNYSNEFLAGLMTNPELVRNVAVVGHLHHGKTLVRRRPPPRPARASSPAAPRSAAPRTRNSSLILGDRARHWPGMQARRRGAGASDRA